MPAAYTEDKILELFTKVIMLIESGLSLRKACKEVDISHNTFYSWVDSNEERLKHYARAMEERAEAIADEILEIADETSHDTITTEKGEMPNGEWISRSRLRVDSRKWLLGKLQPKKYGDKVDVTTQGEKVNAVPPSITVNIVKPIEDEL